ncbi:hypothetical protein ACE1SV_20920 [Streptomyces sp. E-15]
MPPLNSRHRVRKGALVIPAMGASTTGGVTACGPMESGWVIVRAPGRMDGTGHGRATIVPHPRGGPGGGRAGGAVPVPWIVYQSLVNRTIDIGVRWEPCQS